MHKETLKRAVEEAKRFIEKASKAEYYKWPQVKCYRKETSAIKRASMDLTRTLADLRQNR
jgi:ribosomal protein S21